jgi:hypothetical protein
MNLQNITSHHRERPDESLSDDEKAIILLILIPYVFKMEPGKGRVHFYLPPDFTPDLKEMNGLFESWSYTIDWHESSAFDLIGRPLTQHPAGVILEVTLFVGFNLIYDEVRRQKKETGYGFQKHNRGLQIILSAMNC